MSGYDRRHSASKSDQRSEYERDRDRVLYSSAFRRLSGVTQVARADEQDVFHNRLTHSIKVAQVGRRLTQARIAGQPTEAEAWGLDPEVVEAACLAHDLGHPPFGHVGEHELDTLVLDAKDTDGFEGNAQSFRVVTKLAVRFEGVEGLDLTRKVLSALLKYPWQRDQTSTKKSKKWGAYLTETEDFEFARDGNSSELKSVEAELMDFADDIAYSVHDLEDFHRCGLIPWHVFTQNFDGANDMIISAHQSWFDPPSDAFEQLSKALKELNKLLDHASILRSAPYDGSRAQRQAIRFLTSRLIGEFISAIKIRHPAQIKPGERTVEIDASMEARIKLLKQITRNYVIAHPTLVAQQRGYRRIISELFSDLYEDVDSNKCRYLPIRFQHYSESGASSARIVADCISSLTENEANSLHQRLRGYSGGSVLDPIVR